MEAVEFPNPLIWHARGAATIELVHENIDTDTVRDDLETLVMDAKVLARILDTSPFKVHKNNI